MGELKKRCTSIETVIVTLHYPDGTSSNMTIVVGDKLTGVSLDGEDEKGKYVETMKKQVSLPFRLRL